jgi:hypothetical protein
VWACERGVLVNAGLRRVRCSLSLAVVLLFDLLLLFLCFRLRSYNSLRFVFFLFRGFDALCMVSSFSRTSDHSLLYVCLSFFVCDALFSMLLCACALASLSVTALDNDVFFKMVLIGLMVYCVVVFVVLFGC